ncbi:MAG: pyridoxal-phosphate dependent enzyme [Oscillospiraceae bacterium]|nr:pyridoxal-phosphate dependent enzyme [Oscillospiraceae bacterium]
MDLQNSFSETLFACPIVRLNGYAARHGLSGQLYAYCNFAGVTGTGNDALAVGMLTLAEQKGLLAKGQGVVEASDGSFAVSLAAACGALGHALTLVVSADLPFARRGLLTELGARLVAAPAQRDAMHKAAQQLAQREGLYYVNYFENDLNPEFHRLVTGPAIAKRMAGTLDAVVVGVGSGGTVSGVGEHIKAWMPDVKMIAVEPYESMAISGGIIGRHAIAGLGAGFVPENYNPYIVDKVMAVSSANAAATAKELLQKDALPAGTACGAVLCAAKELMRAMPQLQHVLCIFAARSFTE